MTVAMLAAGFLASAVLIAWARCAAQWRAAAQRPAGWRMTALAIAQPLAAALLYCMLFPPARSLPADGRLVVLTERADAVAAAAPPGAPVVALPEAPAADGAVRVPDLGTALRGHPGTTQIHVVGAGLAARDRDAVRGLGISHDPAPLPPGLVGLTLPARAVAGAEFALGGRVQGMPGGGAALFDPAGRRVDAVELDAEGRFALRGVGFAPGPALFLLRILDAAGSETGRADLPLWIDADAAPRVLLLAGAPNAETRALRRWMADAGFPARARIALGAGAHAGDGGVSLDDAALARTDLLVLDARAWTELGEAGRARALAAVRAGAGLLLRADAAIPSAALRPLQSPGFRIEGGAETRAFRLAGPPAGDEAAQRARAGAGLREAPFDPRQADEPMPVLQRRGWRVAGVDAVPMAADAEGDAPGWWRAEGLGRIGVWSLLDSHLLVAHGHADAYAALWRQALGALARPTAERLPAISASGGVGDRVTVCGLDADSDAVVHDPAGAATALRIDPAAGDAGCAGYWPQVPGWHRLALGTAIRPFHVAGDGMPAGVRLARLGEETGRLAVASRGADGAPVPAGGGAVPGTPWPWAAAWLLVMAGLWWLERTRRGRRPRV